MSDGVHVVIVEGFKGLLKSNSTITIHKNVRFQTWFSLRRQEHSVKATLPSDKYKAIQQNKYKMSFYIPTI